MEAKVREATNDDPWYVAPFFPFHLGPPGHERAHVDDGADALGVVRARRGASSTLMTEIAQGYVPAPSPRPTRATHLTPPRRI